MQIVINIPKGRYEDILSGKEFTLYQCDVREVLKNGTLLPKGHGKLIDADACKKNKKDFCEKSTRTNWYDIIDDLFDDAPAIIEADKGE